MATCSTQLVIREMKTETTELVHNSTQLSVDWNEEKGKIPKMEKDMAEIQIYAYQKPYKECSE